MADVRVAVGASADPAPPAVAEFHEHGIPGACQAAARRAEQVRSFQWPGAGVGQTQLGQQGWQQVGQRHPVGAHPSGLGAAGPAQQQRHPHGGLVRAALARQAVVAEHLAVVGGEDHYRRFRQAEPLQTLQDLSDGGVHLRHQAAVQRPDPPDARRVEVCAPHATALPPEAGGQRVERAAGGQRQALALRGMQRVPRCRRRERQVRLDPRAPQKERPLPGLPLRLHEAARPARDPRWRRVLGGDAGGLRLIRQQAADAVRVAGTDAGAQQARQVVVVAGVVHALFLALVAGQPQAAPSEVHPADRLGVPGGVGEDGWDGGGTAPVNGLWKPSGWRRRAT